MKITVDSLIAGEHLPYRIGDVSVRLNGEEMRGAIAADDVEGWVEHYKKDEDGHWIMDKDTYDSLQLFTSYGTVEFVFTPIIEEIYNEQTD